MIMVRNESTKYWIELMYACVPCVVKFFSRFSGVSGQYYDLLPFKSEKGTLFYTPHVEIGH